MAARLKLGGTLRNVHPTLCYQWTCPIQYNPNLSSGSYHCNVGVVALPHCNRHIARSISSAVCHEPNVKCHLGTVKNHHLIHCEKASNVNNHQIHPTEVNCSPIHYAEDKNYRCISQSLLSHQRFFSSFGRDCLVTQSVTRTLSRNLSTHSRTPFLKGHCMHSFQRRSYFEGVYVSLSQSTPVQSMQGLLLELHQWSGLPWWAVIALSTLVIRSVVVLPLAIHQMQVISRLARIDAEIRGLVPELNKEVSIARRMYGFDEQHAKKVFRKQLRSIRQKFIERDNCHPFKTVVLVFFQMPLWICLSVSLRNITFMAQKGISGAMDMKSEGLLWFPDLTAPDPILIPLILLAVNLALTHVHVLRRKGKPNTLQKVLLNGTRVISVFVAVAATINPSSVSFYWVCSSVFGLGQNILFMSPQVRRTLGIPSLTTQIPNPDDDKRQPPKNV